jgi:hypothetical protein
MSPRQFFRARSQGEDAFVTRAPAHRVQFHPASVRRLADANDWNRKSANVVRDLRHGSPLADRP